MWPPLWAQTTPTNQKTTEALESRIKALEERVAILERLNASTTLGQGSVIFVPSETNAAPSSFFEVHPAPNPGWKPFEFNNKTFYYVPLSQ